MMVDCHGTPNYERLFRLMLKLEADKNNAEVKGETYDQERSNYAANAGSDASFKAGRGNNHLHLYVRSEENGRNDRLGTVL